MAIKLVRKKRKNADGSYDVVHYETQAKIVWFEDGESFQEKYDNGELTGPAGADGKNGSDGSPGRDGSNGVTFTPSVNGSGDLSWTNSGGLTNPATVNIMGPAGKDGSPGKDGEPGKDGSPGAAGYTPQRGVDYWTAEDQQQMVNDVLAALPSAEGVKF